MLIHIVTHDPSELLALPAVVQRQKRVTAQSVAIELIESDCFWISCFAAVAWIHLQKSGVMAASNRNAQRGYFHMNVGFYNGIPPGYRIDPDLVQLLPLNIPQRFVGGKRREPLRLAQPQAAAEAGTEAEAK